jgi:hypothetical protein
MGEKTGKKTKAELHEMLAEAVRNTQPQPVRDVQPEPEHKTPPHKTRSAPKHTAKNKSVRASASRKQRRR